MVEHTKLMVSQKASNEEAKVSEANIRTRCWEWRREQRFGYPAQQNNTKATLGTTNKAENLNNRSSESSPHWSALLDAEEIPQQGKDQHFGRVDGR